MPTKKRAVILFNSSNLTGLQKNDAICELTAQCRQDNYAVSRVFYYQDRCDHVTLYKLAKMVSREREKVTVIFAGDTEETRSNLMIHTTLSTLAIAGHIELCLYQQQVNLIPVEENKIRLMQRAANMQKLQT